MWQSCSSFSLQCSCFFLSSACTREVHVQPSDLITVFWFSTVSAGQIAVCQINAVPGIFPLGRHGDPRCTSAIEKLNVLYFLS